MPVATWQVETTIIEQTPQGSRSARSAALFVKQILPSSRNRLNEAQRFSM